MSVNFKPSQVYPSAGKIAAQSIAKSTAKASGWIQVPVGAKWIIVEAISGTLDSGTVTVKIDQAQDSSGTGSKALVASVGTVAANSVLQTETSVDTMDINGGFSYVQVTATTDANVVTGLLLGINVGFDNRYKG